MFLWRLWVVRYSAWHAEVIQQNIGSPPPPPPLLQIICWVIFTLIKAESPARAWSSTSEMFSIPTLSTQIIYLACLWLSVLPAKTSLSLMETTRQVYPLLVTILLLVYFSVQISNPSAKFTMCMPHSTSLSDVWSFIRSHDAVRAAALFSPEMSSKLSALSPPGDSRSNSLPRNWTYWKYGLWSSKINSSSESVPWVHSVARQQSRRYPG